MSTHARWIVSSLLILAFTPVLGDEAPRDGAQPPAQAERQCACPRACGEREEAPGRAAGEPAYWRESGQARVEAESAARREDAKKRQAFLERLWTEP